MPWPTVLSNFLQEISAAVNSANQLNFSGCGFNGRGFSQLMQFEIYKNFFPIFQVVLDGQQLADCPETINKGNFEDRKKKIGKVHARVTE